ncbi:MAG TPA: M48 family metalloprotease [Myxococcota bacterium]|nr:M48 family metalloprotease [Myxococcota bacterium]
MTRSGRRLGVAHVLAAGLALAAAAVACEKARQLDPLDVVAPQLDTERERDLGFEFDQQLQKQVRVIDDPVVAGFMNDLGRTMLAVAGRQPFVYRFRVIPQESLNAFALPGGYIYFHTGTLMAAGSLDELAGVMGHEIAHVKLRHFARMQEQGQLPKILSTLAGIAGAVVTGEPGILLASQGINVALELRWSREFESEADREGVSLVAAAGMRPDAMARFFERIVAAQHGDPERIPPYLFSHPDVDKRIDTVAIMARRVEVQPHDNAALRASFEAAKARLPQLMDTQGAPVITAEPADAEAQALLAAADAASQAEDLERALELLRAAQEQAPSDPALHFRIGELEAQDGNLDAAALAFRRTIELDPTRALVFYRLGEVTRDQGDKQMAVYAFEQASRRAGAAGSLRARADWQVVAATFPLVHESGLAADEDLKVAVERYPADAREMIWWGRLGPRFLPRAEDMRARWLPPGATQAEEERLHLKGDLAVSRLELPEPGAAAGTWTFEVVLDRDVLLRRAVPVGETPTPPAAPR